jgi:ribosomal-protein-alanine N-acetyltransferase
MTVPTISLWYEVRPMTKADIPAVMEIERESFDNAWPPSAYEIELQDNKLARYLVAIEHETPVGPRNGRVARSDTVGFLGLWLGVGEAHIVTVAVRGSHRRRGLGELLIISAIDVAAAKELEVVTLECRVSNTSAQSLYLKYGFRKVGVRPKYYTDNNEDALIMTTLPLDTKAFQRIFAPLKETHRERWGVSSIRRLE